MAPTLLADCICSPICRIVVEEKALFPLITEIAKITVVIKFLHLVNQQLIKKASYSPKWKASIVTITLIAPVVEEIIFRGLILRGIYLIEKGWNNLFINRELTEKENRIERIVRVQISAILFAYSCERFLRQFVFTYVMGVTYAYLSEKYHTVSASILPSGLNRSLEVAIEFYPEYTSVLVLAYIINNVGTIIFAY